MHYKVRGKGWTVYFGHDWGAANKYAAENGGKVVTIATVRDALDSRDSK